MPKNLVIVESPAKAKTIEKFLGKDFTVKSSFGHIRDLTKKGMGIDLESFTPSYEVSPEKTKVVSDLRAAAKSADMVWLASDEDREGEAIAWHLEEVLKLKPEKTKRIVFHEITKNAILKAIDNPRDVDRNLVNAQQARRVLDRIVGFEMSPVLWKKIKSGLSAGRVQSVALRLVVEREKEIREFTSISTFKVAAQFLTSTKDLLPAKYKTEFSQLTEAKNFLEACQNANFSITDIQKKPSVRQPSAPFTTSTLQQEASQRLGYGVSTTMRLAQSLYEEGFITYMRTDSVNLSQEALTHAESFITSNFGGQYSRKKQYVGKSANAQEAHEAIRPTDFTLKTVPNAVLNPLYQLIYKRTIASQMTPAQLEKTKVEISASEIQDVFEAEGEILLLDGFLKVYGYGGDEKSMDVLLPPIQNGENLNYVKITAQERFSRPPARYTEAGLVKKLEDLGIGRPSTYAPTIQTIQNRGYVSKDEVAPNTRKVETIVLEDGKISQSEEQESYGGDKNKFVPTDIGVVVTDFLTTNFSEILDYGFTARVEQEFDDIASGHGNWQEMLDGFYKKFHPKIKTVEEHADRATGERLLGIDPKSGKNVITRISRFGPVVQIGDGEGEEKPLYASLRTGQNMASLTLEEALDLFKLPFDLNPVDSLPVSVGVGRFGPYVKWGENYISVPKGEDPLDINQKRAEELIQDKKIADAPISSYKGDPITKGSGRFGPFIKYKDIFINVPKKYDFENLSQSDITELVEAKLEKEANRFIQQWEKEKIAVENGRWGPFIRFGKKMVKLPRKEDGEKYESEELKTVSLETVRGWLKEAGELTDKPEAKKASVKKASAKKPVGKKPATKKPIVKKTAVKNIPSKPKTSR